MTLRTVDPTMTGAQLVTMINTTAQPGDEIQIQGGVGGTLHEYLCTPGVGALLKAKGGCRIAGDGMDRVRINTALQLSPGAAWSGSGPQWTWTGAIPGPTVNPDVPGGGFQFPQSAYYETVYADGIPLWKIGVRLANGTVIPAGRSAAQVGSIIEAWNVSPFNGHGPLDNLYAGQCFIDYQAGTITVNVSPTLHRLEISRPAFNIFDSQNSGVIVEGLEAYGGGIGFRAGGTAPAAGGDNQRYSDCRAYACSRGVSCAPPADSLLLERVEAAWCFQYGMNGQGDFMTISEPYIHHCNHGKLYANGGGQYGAGGSKFTQTGYVVGGTPDATYGIVGGTGTPVAGSGITVTAPAGRYGLWEYNEGSGPWLDLSNVACLLERQVVRHSSGYGFHYEISYQGVVQDNVIYDVGLSGVYVSTSRDVTVRRNKAWLCGRTGREAWLFRNTDVVRTQPALWGQHRAVHNVFGGGPGDGNEGWIEAGSGIQNGGQEGIADNLGWTQNEWSHNTYHASPTTTSFSWQGAKTYAAWQAVANPAGANEAHHDASSALLDPADPYPADPIAAETPHLSLFTQGSDLYVKELVV